MAPGAAPVHGFVRLLAGVGVADDADAGLHLQAAILDHRGTDGDSGIGIVMTARAATARRRHGTNGAAARGTHFSGNNRDRTNPERWLKQVQDITELWVSWALLSAPTAQDTRFSGTDLQREESRQMATVRPGDF